MIFYPVRQCYVSNVVNEKLIVKRKNHLILIMYKKGKMVYSLNMNLPDDIQIITKFISTYWLLTNLSVLYV